MSCVDINTSTLNHYMRSLNSYIYQSKEVREAIKNCTCDQHTTLPAISQWQNHLGGRYHDLIEATCCPKQPQPSLTYNVGSSTKIPCLLNWNCVNNNCSDCGIEKKLMMS